ncbi:MAG: hypothetical protein HY343_08225 [Lentisphaerae bacterium]|nr:hypothetical protein [Lentisphaerota bacterium]
MKKTFGSIMGILAMTAGLGLSQGQALENAGELVLVVNSANGIGEITKAQAKRLFLGQATEVGGVKLTPAKSKSKDMAALFREQVLNMSEQEEKSYWLKETFKGTVKFVKEFDSLDAVLEFVQADATAIACVSAKAYEDAVAGKKNLKRIAIKNE